MGNSTNSNHHLFSSLINTKNTTFDQKEHPFIVKQVLAQSPQHHQQLITKITKLKQYHSEHLVRIIDSHTVQTHSLCSKISHIYVLMQKPMYTLNTYAEKLVREGRGFQNEEIVAFLFSFVKAIQYLDKQGEEYSTIDQSIFYVNEIGNNQINVKIMDPFFVDLAVDKQQINTIQQQIAIIILSLKPSITEDLAHLIFHMRQGRISLKEIAEKLSENQKKSKNGLQIVKYINNQPKIGRQSINSLVSNGESLMINGGDVSELMFKDFYQHFDNSISDIQMRSLDGYALSETLVDQQISHQFPKRYNKSKAFRKVSKRQTKSEWLSEQGSEKHNITRDQSTKDNFRIQSKTFLSSAKLVESFVNELHTQ